MYRLNRTNSVINFYIIFDSQVLCVFRSIPIKLYDILLFSYLEMEQACKDSATEYSVNQELFEACRGANDRAKALVENLLKEKADVNYKNLSNQTPLMMAANTGKLDCVELLLAQHADVQAEDGNKETALFYACSNQHIACMKALINAGANKNHMNNIGDEMPRTPLMMACEANNTETVKALVFNFKADVNLENELKYNAAFFAVSNSTCLNTLIDAGANIHCRTRGGKETLLMIACKKGNLKCVESLLKHNTDVHATNRKHETALFYALHDEDDILKALIAAGADVNHK